jgi:hypothetical protein
MELWTFWGCIVLVFSTTESWLLVELSDVNMETQRCSETSVSINHSSQRKMSLPGLNLIYCCQSEFNGSWSRKVLIIRSSIWCDIIWYGMIYDICYIWYDIWYMIYIGYDIYDMLWYMIWYVWYDIYDVWYVMIWYMIWYDIYDMIYEMICYMMYDMIYIWYMIYVDIYDMIWYDIWYDIWNDMLYDIRYMIYIYDICWYIWYDIYLTAVRLTPGGSSTVHIYTQTTHRIQRTEHT